MNNGDVNFNTAQHKGFFCELRHYRYRVVSFCTMALSILPSYVMADTAASENEHIEFNTAFMGASKLQNADVSRFEHGGYIVPGNYNVDLVVNDVLVDRQMIEFRSLGENKSVEPCFTYKMLLLMGLDMSKLDAHNLNSQNMCIHIKDISPVASASMDMGALRLDISIPQDAMQKRARGYVNPQLWDQGETAFLLGYNFNLYSLNQRYSGNRNSAGGIATGLDGSPISVANSTLYRLNSDGSYVPEKNGGYMRTPDGRYVAVQPGSFARTRQSGGYNNQNAYLGLNTGFNIAGWRLRNQGNLVWDRQSGEARWTSTESSASHDLTSLKAQGTIGQTSTQGIVFDSTPFRGATIYSDDRMLPNSLQGYAPIVRGVANTRARVELRQNGNIIYETTVEPGPFTINDLYMTSFGGDITVTVFEANGTTHSFLVPFSSIPMLLRPGNNRWSLTGGRVHNQSFGSDGPTFVEGTYQQGINNWLTLYSGIQATAGSEYTSALMGAAFNTQIGAFGMDFSRSRTSTQQTDLSGNSVKVAYSKTFPTSETTFTLATYRYSDGGYMSLNDAALFREQMKYVQREGLNPAESNLYLGRNKVRQQLTLSQNLGENLGSLNINGIRNTYWGSSGSTATYQLGYSNAWGRVSYGITAGRTYTANTYNEQRRFENQYGFNVTLPLGSPSAQRPVLTMGMSHDDSSGTNSRTALTGSFGDKSEYTYNASVNYQNNANDKATFSGGMGWMSPYSNLNGGASWSQHYSQESFGASGGAVIHQGGITFAPQLDINSPIAVIDAPDAKGAEIISGGRTKVNGSGYAIATGLSPYRMNDVILDPENMSADVELKTTRLMTAPRAGAVVPLKFETSSGRAVVINVQMKDGSMPPMGADVIDSQGSTIGMVGQGGQIYIRTNENSGKLLVKWGAEKGQSCHLNFALPPRGDDKQALLFTTVSAVCRL